MRTVLRSASASSGVNARSACWMRLPSCASTLARDVRRRLRDEVDADALRPDHAAPSARRNPGTLGRLVEEQVRLVEEEDELRLVEVADLGSCSNSSASSHIRTVEKSFGLSCTAGSSRHEMIPRPSGVDAEQVRDLELRLAEELACRRRPRARRASAAARRSSGRETPPIPFRSALPASVVEVGQERAQVVEVDERQALARRRSGRAARGSASCVSFAPSTFARSCGPKSVTVARIGHAAARCPPSDRNSTGKPVGSNGRPRSCMRAAAGPSGRRRLQQPGQVALVVGGEDGDAGGRELLGEHLHRLRLPGSGRAGDQAVPVRRRERQAHDRVALERRRRGRRGRGRSSRPRTRTRPRSSRRIRPRRPRRRGYAFSGSTQGHSG